MVHIVLDASDRQLHVGDGECAYLTLGMHVKKKLLLLPRRMYFFAGIW